MPDFQIIALAITGESLGINNESHFCGKLQSDHIDDFPNLIHHYNFKHKPKRIYPMIKLLNKIIADKLNEGEDTYLVDSIPIPNLPDCPEK